MSDERKRTPRHVRRKAAMTRLHAELRIARRERDAARAQVAALQDALRKIVRWADAYPLDVFPEPDFAAVREALEAHGLTLDAVSASNMRHAIEGAGRIAREALALVEDT